MGSYHTEEEQRAQQRINRRVGGVMDSVVIRLTQTMVDKNIIDAVGGFRYRMSDSGLLDYHAMSSGDSVSIEGVFLQREKAEPCSFSMYRTQNERGDCCFSIQQLRQKIANHEMVTGDLLYFFTKKMADEEVGLFMLDLTHNIPLDHILQSVFSAADVTDELAELLQKLREVLHGGPYENSKGVGAVKPKDVGDTFESVMGIDTNNRRSADYRGVVEFKTKTSHTLDTLFALRPLFDGTPIAEVEANDRFRVSAFARYYGYESDKHPGAKTCTSRPGRNLIRKTVSVSICKSTMMIEGSNSCIGKMTGRS